ncbi:kinase, partial [Candidatus Bathyarchaeota archaeon]
MQDEVVKALLKPESYDEKPRSIRLMQTHISFIFLTDKYVYKVKKAVNLGFLDFTTLEKRRYYCERELELNKRLCGDMYLEVVPINKSDNFIKIKGDGITVEYAVKMRKLPQDRMMNR